MHPRRRAWLAAALGLAGPLAAAPGAQGGPGGPASGGGANGIDASGGGHGHLLVGTGGAGGPGAAKREGDVNNIGVGALNDDDRIAPGRVLRFPRDHGAHPGARIEWWYATGWLLAEGQGAPNAGGRVSPGSSNGSTAAAPAYGFQLTFFRSRTGLGGDAPTTGRFSPRQLLFAHAAITDLAARRHVHAQRMARWSGDEGLPEADARRADTVVQLRSWQLQRQATAGGGSVYQAQLPAPEAGLDLHLALTTTQPVLRQGQAGHSRKGPLVSQASHYYSQPQLAVQATVQLAGRRLNLAGTGWLDHEWSDELLAPGATGWDWIGINLADGGALTAFVLRRADGSVLWAGGSHRAAPRSTGDDPPVRAFAPDEVQMTPGRRWTSPTSGASYPVAWQIRTPGGMFSLQALLDNQELDSRASTGAVYWEGLAELRDERGARAGLGYLEMTGRSAPLRLN